MNLNTPLKSTKLGTSPKEVVTHLLNEAGIEVGGSKPWDIQVHDERFYLALLKKPNMTPGESYMDQWWDVGKLDEFVFKLLNANLHFKVRNNFSLFWRLLVAQLYQILLSKGAHVGGLERIRSL